MRYELTDHEWAAIKQMLSNTSHAVSPHSQWDDPEADRFEK
jgi:hypothetical protein